MIELKLPIPPTINHYYTRTRRGMIIGKRGLEFRKETLLLFRLLFPSHKPFDGKVKMSIDFIPPDRRRRDLDNLNKCIWDSLEKAGVYENDSQVVEFHMYKKEPEKPGFIIVTVEGV